MTDSGNIFVMPIESHPIPLDQDEIDEEWENNEWLEGEPPHVDAAHEDYTATIAEYGDWQVFRGRYPFDIGGVVFWNGAYGAGLIANDEEGSWHQLVNLFAEIVDEEGDCRDADYSDSLRQSGAYNQRCKNCGGSWTVG